jgi:putative ABC transport system ATP-binding protein
MKDGPIVRLIDISKVYRMPGYDVVALNRVSLEIKGGEFVAIVGPSGSGKSTLLYVLGMLITATQGRYLFEDQDISGYSDERLSELRNRTIGFVFQAFHLIPQLNILQNVELPLVYQGQAAQIRHALCQEYIRKVGLWHRIRHRPGELSSGEMQRVAIARALVNQPSLILADEPTGNLDRKTGEEIVDILWGLNSEGRTIVVATHNLEIAKRAKRVLELRDGRLV